MRGRASRTLEPNTYPVPEPLDDYFIQLARMVAKTSYLPHVETVRALKHAVFPTARARKSFPRMTPIIRDGATIGMYDDNTTPTWAFEWSHGIVGQTRPKGWVFAHVWSECDDIESYTHVANLAMVPESFSTLTDKAGPLTGYLRWHAWTTYGWKPAHVEELQKPKEYDSIAWRYLQPVADPHRRVDEEFKTRANERLEWLRPLMAQWRGQHSL